MLYSYIHSTLNVYSTTLLASDYSVNQRRKNKVFILPSVKTAFFIFAFSTNEMISFGGRALA